MAGPTHAPLVPLNISGAMPSPVPRRAALLLCAPLTALGVAGALALRARAATNPRAQVALLSGQTLASGQSITSPDGHYTLTMMTDGNLVLEVSNPYGSPRVTWSSGTGSSPGASAQLLANGNLVVDDASGATIWSNNVASPGCANLDLQDDGNLVLYNSAGAYWASRTLAQTLQPNDELLPGQTIIAPGGRYELQMGTDGFLRMIDSSGAVWTSGGAPAGSYAVMEGNGNLQIRSTGGNVDWSTKTYSSADANSTVELTSEGDVEVVTPSGSTAWDSGSGTTRAGLRYLGITRSYTDCPAPPTPPRRRPAPRRRRSTPARPPPAR